MNKRRVMGGLWEGFRAFFCQVWKPLHVLILTPVKEYHPGWVKMILQPLFFPRSYMTLS